MILQETQDYYADYFRERKDAQEPTGGQNLIFLSNKARIPVFERQHPNFVKVKETRLGNGYKDQETNERWKVVFTKESARGRRCKKAIVDTKIPYDLFSEVVLPSAMILCCSMEFFS